MAAVAHPPPGVAGRIGRRIIGPADTDDEKLKKTLLVFACGLMGFAAVLWLGIYWMMGVRFSATESKSAIRAGEMQRRYRQRGGRRERTLPDFLVGAHALLQCDALITRDDTFFRDYFKGLKVIVPHAA